MEKFLIGHCENEFTGVSVILAPEGAVGGVDVRGGAPGTRETDLLNCGNSVDKINAVALCGGSAFGLDACSGVMEYLYGNNIGFATPTHKVPIVCGAVIFDLLDKELHYPDKNMGLQACKNAIKNNTARGAVGAGKGATVGKIAGMQAADKGGLGTATVMVQGVTLTAVVAVNAFGDVYDCETQSIIAGAKQADGRFLDTNKFILNLPAGTPGRGGTNTTIGVIMTDARLDKAQSNRLAKTAHNGLALSIRPVHTAMDGDTLFVMASGEKEADFNVLCVAAAECVRKAVLNSVANGK